MKGEEKRGNWRWRWRDGNWGKGGIFGGHGGSVPRILGDERKERLGGKEERKGGREGMLGKESEGRKWWNVEKKWE